MVGDGFLAEVDDLLEDGDGGWDAVAGATESGFHDQGFGVSPFGGLCAEALAEFKVAGVEERALGGF